jgi:PhoH-like ATPase
MRKTFVLDTNVLLFDSQAILKFGQNDVVIPITVIEEVDRFKKDLNEIGRNARQFSRAMDELRRKGNLAKGVELENKGHLRVDLIRSDNELPSELINDKADNRILAVAYNEMKVHGPDSVLFVTKDTNLRIKADALGIPADDYEASKVSPEAVRYYLDRHQLSLRDLRDAINIFGEDAAMEPIRKIEKLMKDSAD